MQFNNIPQQFTDLAGNTWLLVSRTASKQYRVFPLGEDATSTRFKAHTKEDAEIAFAELAVTPAAPEWISKGIRAERDSAMQQQSAAPLPMLSERPTVEMINGMFRVRSASDVLTQAALQPDPVELYPHLIVEGELSILFADTGIGKTVFAVQMGIAIASQKKVLYVDLELSDKQFEKRFKSESGEHYDFPPNFYRADFAPRFESPSGKSYEDYFISSLESAIEETGADVVMIDNMTKLAAGDTDSAKAAIPVMESLSRLKFDRGITFVILEHNKKVDASRPISLNDLQGSKMKANFADGIFSIGRSQTDKYIRYVKQLKVRSGELIYDTENVATYEITANDGFLHFEYMGYGSEFDHLRSPGDSEKVDRKADQYSKVQELRRSGYKGDALAKMMGMSKGTISKLEAEFCTRSEDKPKVS